MQKRIIAAPTSLVDESGDNFEYFLLSNTIPVGGAAGSSPSVLFFCPSVDPMSVTVTVDSDFEAEASVPANTDLTCLDGVSVNGGLVLATLTFHRGDATGQAPYYPGGSYEGDIPAAFGVLGFATDTGVITNDKTRTPKSDTNITFSLDFTDSTPNVTGDTKSDHIRSGISQAFITDIITDDSTVFSCSYADSQKYGCVNVTYTFNAGAGIEAFRVDGGSCPTN